MLVGAAVGCGDDGEPPCVQADLTCAPLYPPTFDDVFDRTLSKTCVGLGVGCHSAEGSEAGLVFEDKDTAYRLLTEAVDGDARVVAGDPNCSLLTRRIAATDSDFVMPPGSALSAAEQCAIIKWVADGAKR